MVKISYEDIEHIREVIEVEINEKVLKLMTLGYTLNENDEFDSLIPFGKSFKYVVRNELLKPLYFNNMEDITNSTNRNYMDMHEIMNEYVKDVNDLVELEKAQISSGFGTSSIELSCIDISSGAQNDKEVISFGHFCDVRLDISKHFGIKLQFAFMHDDSVTNESAIIFKCIFLGFVLEVSELKKAKLLDEDISLEIDLGDDFKDISLFIVSKKLESYFIPGGINITLYYGGKRYDNYIYSVSKYFICNEGVCLDLPVRYQKIVKRYINNS